MKTRFAALAIAAAMAVSALTGCGSGNLNSDDVVAEFGDTKIKAGVAEFYARYQQASYEAYYMPYYGDNMWTTEVSDGSTYEDSVKNNALDTLKTMYVLETHMDEYNVEYTSDDEAAVAEAAQAFVDANDGEALSASAGNIENVKEVLKLITIQRKMYNAMIEDADTEVSDDEAAQKSMSYAFFSFETTDDSGNKTTLDDDGKGALKETAKNFQTEAANGTKTFEECAEKAGVEAQTATFDSDTTSPSTDLIKAADVLGEGQVTDVIETDSGYYVAKVTSMLDREATDAKKTSIISERQQTLYSDLCKEWVEAADITVHENVWKKLDFTKHGVTMKTQSNTDNTESGSDSTTDSNTDNTESGTDTNTETNSATESNK